MTTNGLSTLTGQQTYGNAHGGAITFPWDAVEIKVDWVPTSSFNLSFQCPDRPEHSTRRRSTARVTRWWDCTSPRRCCPTGCGRRSSRTAASEPQPLRPQSLRHVLRSVGNHVEHALCEGPAGAAAKRAVAAGRDRGGAEQGVQQLLPHGRAERIRQQRPARAAEASSVVRSSFNAGVAPGQASCITTAPVRSHFDGSKAPNPPGTPEDNFGGPPKKG